MSQGNVKVVRRAYEMWNAGEMEVFDSVFASDVVMSSPTDWPDDITSHGRDEAHRRLIENRSLFESVEEASEFFRRDSVGFSPSGAGDRCQGV